jgi:hypothetical protein
VAIWSVFCVLVCCTKKNLATQRASVVRVVWDIADSLVDPGGVELDAREDAQHLDGSFDTFLWKFGLFFRFLVKKSRKIWQLWTASAAKKLSTAVSGPPPRKQVWPKHFSLSQTTHMYVCTRVARWFVFKPKITNLGKF